MVIPDGVSLSLLLDKFLSFEGWVDQTFGNPLGNQAARPLGHLAGPGRAVTH
jgi:hypothetical protein